MVFLEHIDRAFACWRQVLDQHVNISTWFHIFDTGDRQAFIKPGGLMVLSHRSPYSSDCLFEILYFFYTQGTQ